MSINRLLRRLPVPMAISIERAKRSLYSSVDFKRRRAILAKHAPDGRVCAGPFKGMRYVGEAVGSAHVAKVFGTYEHELHATFDRAIAMPFDRLIDIGAAEGYYAVGLAMRMPGLCVTTFDIDPRGRHLQRQLARLNGVADRLDVRGAGDPAAIEAALADARRPLVICDCEGAEDELLKPDETPSLRRASVLVELHDHLVPGVGDRIRARFAATHAIQAIAQDDDAMPTDATAGLADGERDLLGEGRVGRQSWLWMTPTTY